MVRPNAFLASIDIKDAFYSVPIHSSHKKYLKFICVASPYQFEVMPNGYIDAMRAFAKLLKPVFAHLREQGYTSIIYVDDSLLYGDTFTECLNNVLATLDILQELGFVIHSIKSVLIPTQNITFLGFDFDTRKMTITLTSEKKEKIKKLAIELLTVHKVKIRMLASFLGNLTASLEAVPYGKLHYRKIESEKIKALKISCGNFDATWVLSEPAKGEISWWRDNIEIAFANIKSIPEVDYTIHTDARNEGWGASDGVNQDINGRWSIDEKSLHINVLELMAVKFAVLAYVSLESSIKHVKIMSDNTTAISYINKQGMTLNALAVEIWEICIKRGAHISAVHIPGIHNVLADAASREFQDSAEWMIPPGSSMKL